MAIYTDFFSALPSEIDTMHFPADLEGRLVVLAKNITEEDLAQLAFVITSRSDGEPTVVRKDEDGIIVYQLSEEVMERLVALNDEQILEAAVEWDLWPVEECANLLQELRSLSRSAKERREAIFMYLCA